MNSSTGPIYCVDTSALIDGLERYYPESNFPAMWREVDQLIQDGRMIMSEEVWEEVQQKDAVAKAWCEPRKDDLIVPTDAAVAGEVAAILASHPRLTANLKNRNRADPFVIAVARLHEASVLTGEIGGTASKPKIPFVCDDLGLPHLRLTDLIVQEDWKF